MPKYLVQGSFSTEGAKGLLKDGGSKRRAAIQELAESIDAKLEAYYFAFGENDVVAIFDAPDNASIAAASLVVSARGAGNIKTTVLLTPEEMDKATKKTVRYRPPGQ